MKKILLAVLSLLTVQNITKAECICTCVDGENTAICDNSYDFHPMCPAKFCPLTPPSFEPVETPFLKSLGAKSCEQKQILNPSTNKYEWQRVCDFDY